MVKDKFIGALERALPKGHISTDAVDIITYSYDATGRKFRPWVVAFPESEREVIEILKLAQEYRVPVIPRGAGSGLSGGSVPVQGGVVVTTERMCQIIDIDRTELLATVEPGVVTGHLHREVEREGLFYPPDPASLEFCTIGGNIAENAGGLRAVKYGVTRDYVKALRIVFPGGEVYSAGVKTVKGVVGYDLVSLIVGSEGTLGFVTQATLRLIPQPEAKVTITAFFPSPELAGKAVFDVISTEGILPATLEFADRTSLDAVRSVANVEIPEKAGAMLLIEEDGFQKQVRINARKIVDALSRHSPVVVREAMNEGEREALWKTRRAISPSLAKIAPGKLNEDVTVPRKNIPALLQSAEEISQKYRVKCACFGHAGDGNIHVNFLFNDKDADESRRAEAAVSELMKAVVQMGGTISGEHGVGIMKKQYIELELGKSGVQIMKRIKQAFDPEGIMNPGKIFPDV